MRNSECAQPLACATGFIGSGQFVMPHLHVGGDFWVVIGAAIAMVATTVWAFRRWGTSAGGLDPALAEAVDEVFVACDLDEPAPVERTEQSDEFAGV